MASITGGNAGGRNQGAQITSSETSSLVPTRPQHGVSVVRRTNHDRSWISGLVEAADGSYSVVDEGRRRGEAQIRGQNGQRYTESVRAAPEAGAPSHQYVGNRSRDGETQKLNTTALVKRPVTNER